MEIKTGQNVFTSALDRIYSLYKKGKVVVSFSAGKDSGVCLELAIIAARKAGKLPVHVLMRDEEIMLPGTYEYAERVANRKEVDFKWIIANQPIINIFNRKMPYFWVFDPQLDSSEWVRQPPDCAEYIEEKGIQALVSKKRYEMPEDRDLFSIMGLRANESMARRMGIFSKGGFLNQHRDHAGAYRATPIYDWKDGDVWKFIHDYGFDYNHAYDVMYRMGIARQRMRIAPPTMTTAAVNDLGVYKQAWPRWFNRVEERCPGMRTTAMFGRRAVHPIRRHGESWKDCYHRTCIDDAPEWISERAIKIMKAIQLRHTSHSTENLPESLRCNRCGSLLASWMQMAKAMYTGDPFSLKQKWAKPVEPEFFREGSGVWGGDPTW